MTFVFAFTAFAQAPRVAELPDSASREVAVEAIVKLPELSPRERWALEVVARAIPMQTQEYLPREMLQITDGRTVRVRVMPDVVRLSVSVNPNSLESGLSLTEALLRRATLSPEALEAAGERAAAPEGDRWQAGVIGERLVGEPVTPNEARRVYDKVFRPDAVWLAVGGTVPMGLAAERWAARTEDWKPAPEPPRDYRLPTKVEPLPGPSGFLDLRGPEFAGSDAAFPSRFLALVGLGVGKGSSVFRVWREERGWSYRQEAILWPTPGGFRPRLVAAIDEVAVTESEARESLLADVERWKDSDLARARGLATGILRNGLSLNPIYGTGEGTLSDRTFLAAWWPMKTGRRWDPAAIVTSMGHVTLDELREQARAILR